MWFSVDLLFPRLHNLASDPQEGELFRLNSCDVFDLRKKLLEIRKEVDRQIAFVESELKYIKRELNSDDAEQHHDLGRSDDRD